MAAVWETAPPAGRRASLDAAVGEYVPAILRHVTGAIAAVLPTGDARPGAADRRELRQALHRQRFLHDRPVDRHRHFDAAASSGVASSASLSRSIPSARADPSSRITDTCGLRLDGGRRRAGAPQRRPPALADRTHKHDGRYDRSLLLYAPGAPTTPADSVEP